MYELREGALRELDLETSAMECATFIGEYSETHAMEFPDFLEVVCTGAGSPEEVLLRRFNSARKKLEYNSEDSSCRAGDAGASQYPRITQSEPDPRVGYYRRTDADGSGGCGKPALHQNLTTDYAVVANLL